MATASLPGLQAYVAQLGLEPIPSFAAAEVLHNPVDIYHSYLAEHFQALVKCDPNLVYDSIQPCREIGNGDLDVILPKLKLPGSRPKELAGELVKKVFWLNFIPSELEIDTSSLTHIPCPDSNSSPLRRSLQRWHSHSILLLSKDHSTTSSPLHKRPANHVWCR